MVIICLIICNNVGKIIFGRQFIPHFSKSDLFHQSIIFIKNYSLKSELKYIDLPPYRYTYQLLNKNLILFLITKIKNNNIIIEQETLKICYRLIQERLGTNINENLIKQEGINLAIDLEEIIQGGLIQNLKFGEIQSRINMIRVDKEEIKKKIEIKLNKQKNNMIKQFNEMEKIEKINNKNKNDANNNELNININLNVNNINNNKKNKEENIIHDNIRLNYKFDLVKIEKPIIFKTPSGKVVILAEQKKAVDNSKEKEINGLKLRDKNK